MISILGGKTSWVAAAATAAGALAIGYCIYFDAKRHQDPNFKKNLKESELIINFIKIIFLQKFRLLKHSSVVLCTC